MYAARSAAPAADVVGHLHWFRSVLPANALVADVGCGPGRDSALLSDLGLRVVGLDRSMGMLRAGAGSVVAQADMRALPLAARVLDGLWTQAALLHVPRSDLDRVLAEFARVVRPGGALFLNTAEGEGDRLEPVVYSPEHHRWFVYHDVPSLIARVTAAGFTVSEVTCRSANREWINVHARRD